MREHRGIEMIHHIRDVSFGEAHSTRRTGNGPIEPVTIRCAIINVLRDAGYLHIPDGRRDPPGAQDVLHLHGFP